MNLTNIKAHIVSAPWIRRDLGSIALKWALFDSTVNVGFQLNNEAKHKENAHSIKSTIQAQIGKSVLQYVSLTILLYGKSCIE